MNVETGSLGAYLQILGMVARDLWAQTAYLPPWWPIAGAGGTLVLFRLARLVLTRLLDLALMVAIVLTTEMAFHVWLGVR